MKQLYLSPKVKSLLPYALNQSKKFIIFIALTAFCIRSNAQQLIFNNSKLESGSTGADGAVYRFTNVTSNIDALFKITGRSDNKVKLKHPDFPGSGVDEALQPRVEYNDGNVNGTVTWWMEFEISFVNHATNIAANVLEFNITALDIDGDGENLQEYMNFYSANTYTFESQTLLNVSSVNDVLLNGSGLANGKKFLGPSQSFGGVDTNATDILATMNYKNTNKFSLRVGGIQTGSGHSNAGDRMNALWFRSFTYTAPNIIMPVKLQNFNAVLQNRQVMLNWSTTEELNVSHFVIEKSVDGFSYRETAILFTEENSHVLKSYEYKDQLSADAGIVYYRLRIVDLDGREIFSPVRLIRPDPALKNQLELLTFPNPVATELRITIPEAWQKKAVTYQLFDLKGRLVKQLINNSASQIQVINLQSVTSGNYFLVASNGGEKLTQRIVKK